MCLALLQSEHTKEFLFALNPFFFSNDGKPSTTMAIDVREDLGKGAGSWLRSALGCSWP
jgi:hypothetical protein